LLVLFGNLKEGKPILCWCFLWLNTDSFIRSIYYVC